MTKMRRSALTFPKARCGPLGAGLMRPLRRLLADRSGNTMMIMAMALLPLLGMIGAGIDMGRGYFAKTRLQQSCDAAVLAARRAQVGTNLSDAAKAEAERYFNFNFKLSEPNARDVSFAATQNGTDEVLGVAKAKLDTSLMYIFGFTNFSFEANCGARMNLSDTDVMFVLDTTASMNETNSGDPGPRIAGLKVAVKSFFATMEAARQTDTKVRYGFMPFATNVNVGDSLKPEWMARNWVYPSRVSLERQEQASDGYQWVEDPAVPVRWTNSVQKTQTELPPEQCKAPVENYREEYRNKTPDRLETQPNGDVWAYYEEDLYFFGSKYSVWTNSNGICVVHRDNYDGVIKHRGIIRKPVKGGLKTVYYWDYKNIDYDVSGFTGFAGNKAGRETKVRSWPIDTNRVNLAVKWNGCIEERKTTRFGGGLIPANSIPSEALDMDISLVPDAARPDSLWGPALPQLVFARHRNGEVGTYDNMTTDEVITQYQYYANAAYYNDGYYANCPAPAKKLAALTSGALDTYLNGLTLGGDTYPDIGLLWGARFLVADGIFASENVAADSTRPIGRHLILMTDGQVDTKHMSYTSYSLEQIMRRRTPYDTYLTDQMMNDVVSNRFALLCEAAKAKNLTIWVVAFGTTLTPLLENCSTGGRAYQAQNSRELEDAFKDIASQIGGLRVSR